MQQIYRHRDQHLEIYTTVFSPQVCRTRTRHVDTEKVAVVRIQYRARWPKELDLDQGDLIQVLFKRDDAWWFGRSTSGDEGYFPAACVELLQCGASSSVTPPRLRRGSVPVIVEAAAAPCGCTSGLGTPRFLRKTSDQRKVDPGPLALTGSGLSATAGSRSSTPLQRSRSLLHRVLTKSRRKSCPHLSQARLDTSSDNTAFQPD